MRNTILRRRLSQCAGGCGTVSSQNTRMNPTKSVILLFIVLVCFAGKINAVNESITTGSFIINMGITPQTTANGLKPYGMIYDLIVNYNVSIVWSINSAKAKDGTDFTYNAVNYKGGTFIVEKEFITAAVTARITYWQGQGVQGVYTTSAISVPLYKTLTVFPIVMIDNLSGYQAVITNYYTLAGIPSSAYTIGAPVGLTQCFDIWCNPHDEPTWTNHQYLYNFVTTMKGWIWVQCHAASVLESVRNPASPFTQLNFLSSAGLQCYGAGNCGSIAETHTQSPSSPYTYNYPTDGVMQFMSTLAPACDNGSERWYSPITTGQWNAGTYLGITDNHNSAPRKGALIAYGPAYGNAANGWVMYEGGHDLTGNGTAAEQVSAMRAYFNFILLAGYNRKMTVTVTIPPATSPGNQYAVSAVVTGGSPTYTYQWLSSLGGTFVCSTCASTQYTAPVVASDTTDIVKCIVTDSCGRATFEYRYVTNLANSPLPIVLEQFKATPEKEDIKLYWTTASEMNNDYFTIYRSGDGSDFATLNKIPGGGNSASILEYCMTDNHPLTGTSYYRLSQTDYDGKEKFYEPVAVNWEPVVAEILGVEKITPNPFIKKFTIDFFCKNSQKVKLEVVNMRGTKVFEKSVDANENFNTMEIDNLPGKESVYFIFLACAEWRTRGYKLVRENKE